MIYGSRNKLCDLAFRELPRKKHAWQSCKVISTSMWLLAGLSFRGQTENNNQLGFFLPNVAHQKTPVCLAKLTILKKKIIEIFKHPIFLGRNLLPQVVKITFCLEMQNVIL